MELPMPGSQAFDQSANLAWRKENNFFPYLYPQSSVIVVIARWFINNLIQYLLRLLVLCSSGGRLIWKE